MKLIYRKERKAKTEKENENINQVFNVKSRILYNYFHANNKL